MARRTPIFLQRILLAFATLAGITAPAAQGQTTYVWNNSGTLWDSTSSWTPNGYPGLAMAMNDLALFDPSGGGSAASQPAVDGTFTFQQLTVANTSTLGNYTFQNSDPNNPGSLVLSASAPLGGVQIRGVGVTTFNGPSIAGFSSTNLAFLSVGHSTGLTLTGTSVANTNIGSTMVQGGTLTVDNSSINTLNRLSLGINNLYLQDGGRFVLKANSAGGTVAVTTGGTGSGPVGLLNLASGNTTVEISLAGTQTGQTILQFGGYAPSNTPAATVNYVLDAPAGSGLTLGGPGQYDPKIQFNQTTNLVVGALLKTNSSGTGMGANSQGVAFVNGTAFASWNGTSVVALVGTPVDSIGSNGQTPLSMAPMNGNVTFTPDAGGMTNLTTTITISSIKLNITSSMETSLNLGSNVGLNVITLLLPGSNNYSITGASGSRLFNPASGSGIKTVYVTDPTTVLSVGVNMGSTMFPFAKSGPGILALTGTTDQLNQTSGAKIYLDDGVLRAAPGTNLGTNNVLSFRGGVLEITNGGTFVRGLGNSNGNVNWDSGNGTLDGGSGGFSAFSQNALVNIGSGAALTWGQQYFVQDGSALKFGSVASDSTVIWQNNLALDSGTAGAYAIREIQVTLGTGTTGDKTQITGQITGSSSTDLIKTGTGTLELANPAGNTYAGNTLIAGGTLLVSNTTSGTSATGTGAVTVGSGGTLAGTGYIVPAAGKGVTVLPGGTLAPGSPAGILTVAAPVSLQTGSVFSWTLTNPSPSPDLGGMINTGASNGTTGQQSRLTVTGTGNTLTAGDITFKITEQGVTLAAGQTYSWLVSDTGGSPVLGNVTFDLTSAPDFTALVGTEVLSLQTSGNNVYLNLAPVPEPAAGLLVAAAGVILTFLYKRTPVTQGVGERFCAHPRSNDNRCHPFV